MITYIQLQKSLRTLCLVLSFTAMMVLGVFQDACAETVSVLGLPLHIDQHTPVDATSEQITIDGQSMIIARESRNDAIVALTFRVGSKASFESEDIQKFIERAFVEGFFKYAAQALPFLLNSSSLDQLGMQSFFEKYAQNREALSVFKIALLDIRANPEVFSTVRKNTTALTALLFELAMNDPEWTSTNAISLIFPLAEEYRTYTVQRFAKSASNRDYEGIRGAVAAIRVAFGEDDQFYKTLHLLSERVLLVLQRKQTDLVDPLYPLVEAARQDKLSSRILYPLVAQQLHEAAEREIERNRPGRAMMIIARTDFTRRTPSTHEIVRKAFTKLTPQDDLVMSDKECELMLFNLAQKDPDIARDFEAFLETKIYKALDDGDIASSDLVFAWLLKLRPDPNAYNDAVRVEQAVQALRSNNRSFAVDRVSEVRTGFTLVDRFRLGFAGLFINRYLATAFVVIPVTTVFWFMLIELRRMRSLRLKQALERQQKLEALRATNKKQQVKQEEANRAFTQGALNKPSDPRYDEYIHCLSILGLPQDASQKDIKSIYRNLVKSNHPDMQTGTQERGKASNKFIELTQAYDRALELRAQLGLDIES